MSSRLVKVLTMHLVATTASMPLPISNGQARGAAARHVMAALSTACGARCLRARRNAEAACACAQQAHQQHTHAWRRALEAHTHERARTAPSAPLLIQADDAPDVTAERPRRVCNHTGGPRAHTQGQSRNARLLVVADDAPELVKRHEVADVVRRRAVVAEVVVHVRQRFARREDAAHRVEDLRACM
jgi:hypothetical protein